MLTKPLRGHFPNLTHPYNRNLAGLWVGNEGTGDIVNDLSGNKRHISATDTSWTPGHNGTALLMDGVSSYETIPFGEGYNPYNIPLSIVVHTTPIDISSYQDLIGTGQRCYISKYNSHWSMGIQNFSGASSSNLQFAVQNKLTCIAFIISNGTATLWVNGEKGNTAYTNHAYTSFSLASDFMGFRRWTGAYYYNGTIDMIRIYTRKLSVDEIQIIATSPWKDFY